MALNFIPVASDRAGLKALFEEWSKFDILVCAATGGLGLPDLFWRWT
ncbi:MAG: hypothetical protein CM1200mP39_25980 [Dehalococcoidia bacterium]|nr:MAG: hypothetical protein CM1200mP39_25980 [Dehalococcoidia bacterium]